MKKLSGKKIGIDISQAVHRGTGVARFTTGLVKAILDYDKDHHWTFLFYSMRNRLSPEIINRIKNSHHRLVTIPLPPTAVSALWNNIHRFPVENLVGNLDWFVTSDWIEPPSRINKATIVHDLAFLRYPETIHPKILANQRLRFNWLKKESRLIFADSSSTKNDLINLGKIEPEKIQVNYPGLTTTSNIIPSEIVLEKYQIKKPFILTVGKIEPRKNLARLIAAFNQLAYPTLSLVIAGPAGWENKFDQDKQNGRVKILGCVLDQELYALYQSAQLFVYPSLWEGFGFPIIEAMRAGVPVATSNVSALAEIAKDAAVLFNPLDIDSITLALNKIIKDPALQKQLSASGKRRALQFSWKKYYNTLVGALDKIK